MKSNYHYPVLLKESIEGLNIKKDGIYVDATLGRAGHSSKILSSLNKDGLLISLDQDIEAISYSKEILSKIGDNYKIIKTNFKDIAVVLRNINIQEVDGIIFDLGVSSPQFDEDYRGFSYRNNNILDMRMDLDNPLTAKYIVNNYSLNDLVRIFKEYGEEKYSYSIAKNIIKSREVKEIETTFDLVEIIKVSKPQKELKKIGHPAKQVFQALRIEVNDELNVLKKALEDAIKLLKKNGRLVVITFHSLEDRIVKNLFKEYAVTIGDRKNDFINPNDIKTKDYKIITNKVITATLDELTENHRSKSAKLRILEKVK